jgi:ABC-type multidrug transport system fused ATPase/permease subunit
VLTAPAKSPAATEHRTMLTLLRAHWVSMTVSVFLLSVATVLTLLQPLLAGRIIDRAAAGSPILRLATLLMIMLVGQLLLSRNSPPH